MCAGKNRVPIYGGFPQNNELYELFSTDPNEVEQAHIRKHFDNNGSSNDDGGAPDRSEEIAKIIEADSFQGFDGEGKDKKPQKLVLPEIEPAKFNEDVSNPDDDAFFERELIDEDPFAIKEEDYSRQRFDSGVKTIGNHVANDGSGLPNV